MTNSSNLGGELNSDAITIQLEPELSVTDFISILKRSTLSGRRPVDDRERMNGMLSHADLIATARLRTNALVGVARAITDYHYCTYLADLAVDAKYQRQGIGRRLIEFAHQKAGSQTTLILLSAPAATSYYPHIGLEPHESCWIKPAKN